MRSKIDHAARKREIVRVSLRLFAQKGYSAVNFGTIASACRISRTLLYGYFKDKRAIFNEAIDEATSTIEAKYAEIVHSRHSADSKLRQICITVLSVLFERRDFVCVISDYLAQMRRSEGIPLLYVKRHTIGLKRIIHSLIIEAKRRGEYARSVNPVRAISIIYSQFLATAMMITTMGGADFTEAIDRTDAVLAAMRSPDAPARLFH